MLDCETPKGKVFIEQQRIVQGILESKGYTVVEMAGKDNPVDILLCRKEEERLTVIAACEIRSRVTAGTVPVTTDYLRRNGGYLITERKLWDGIKLSKVMQVPYFVIVNLIQENKILIWKITDMCGNPLERVSTKETRTRRTVNGGLAWRSNAFLSMDSPNLTIIAV